MKQLAVALQNYHDRHRRFPPACTYDEYGNPLHSWRVLILPYLEETIAYLELDLKQPWNSPRNWPILEKIDPRLFHCPSGGGEPFEASYLAVVGPDGIWADKRGIRIRQITDGPSQTILLVEVANSGIHWAEPRDLPWEQAMQGVNPPHVKFAISSGHLEGAHVAYADGSTRFLNNTMPVDELRARLTREAGEPVAESP